MRNASEMEMSPFFLTTSLAATGKSCSLQNVSIAVMPKVYDNLTHHRWKYGRAHKILL